MQRIWCLILHEVALIDVDVRSRDGTWANSNTPDAGTSGLRIPLQREQQACCPRSRGCRNIDFHPLRVGLHEVYGGADNS
jgi:hypothetical protein